MTLLFILLERRPYLPQSKISWWAAISELFLWSALIETNGSSISVMGVIVFGQAHDQAGILIEPKAEYAIDVGDEDQLIKFRNLLWLVDFTSTLVYWLKTPLSGQSLTKPIRQPRRSVRYSKKWFWSRTKISRCLALGKERWWERRPWRNITMR